MAELEEKHVIFGPFDEDDPVDDLLRFYRTNGYAIVSTQTAEPPDGFEVIPDQDPDESPDAEAEDDSGDVTVGARLERGEPRAGWWSSDMTRLETTLEIELTGRTVEISYVVDVSGQRLLDEEREFWKKEAVSAERYLTGDGDITNWLEVERDRASRVRRDFIRMGLWLGAVVFFVLVIGFVLITRS